MSLVATACASTAVLGDGAPAGAVLRGERGGVARDLFVACDRVGQVAGAECADRLRAQPQPALGAGGDTTSGRFLHGKCPREKEVPLGQTRVGEPAAILLPDEPSRKIRARSTGTHPIDGVAPDIAVK